MVAVIATEGLTKHFRSGLFRRREIRAVNGITLEVPEGAAFGLLGPNGSGKTTFLKMLLSVVHPTTGQARLFGRPVAEPESRRAVGYLPENHRFPTYNTGRQMLDFYAALSGMSAADRQPRVMELLERVGLAERADDRIGKYSKGMLQRLGLAQALMHRPRLLFLDEPGDGVDPVGRRQIREILNEQRADGVTIFLNSHLLSEVEHFCDEVAIIRRGEVALAGKTNALTAGSGYRLTAASVTDETRNRLAERAAAVAKNNGFLDFRFSDRAALNAAVDLARQGGAEVESVERSRSTLEDVFIQTMQAEEEHTQ